MSMFWSVQSSGAWQDDMVVMILPEVGNFILEIGEYFEEQE
jgi:hypothetical protein